MSKVNSMIKKLRLEKGLNQEEFAKQLHVTRQAVSNWETGKNQPDVEMLTQIAEHFGVSVEYFIYGKVPTADNGTTDNGEKKFVWDKGRFHFAITYYPEKAMMLGAVLAMIISYVNWRSIGWAILHGVLNWVYVIYYIIRY